MTTAVRVWVGCLACYNAGDLTGEWFDADEAPTDMCDFNDAVPSSAEHSEEAHDELWVFDHEGLSGLLSGACSPVDARELAQQLAASGNPSAYGAYASTVGCEYATVEGFEDAFCGEFEYGADYAEELAGECGMVNSADRWPLTCIDWDRAWRELEAGGDNFAAPTASGSVYIFRGV